MKVSEREKLRGKVVSVCGTEREKERKRERAHTHPERERERTKGSKMESLGSRFFHDYFVFN